MNKFFTWLFGAITGLLTGLLTGVVLVAWSMVVDPKGFVKMAENHIEE